MSPSRQPSSLPVVVVVLIIFWSTCCSPRVLVQARNNRMPPGPWSLPRVGTQNARKREFLPEGETFYALLESLRGGSSYDQQQGDNRPAGGGADRGYSNDYRRQDDDYYNQNRDSPRRDDSYGGDERDRFYDDKDYYDDRGSSPSSRRRQDGDDGNSLFSSAQSIVKNGNRQVGMALIGSGALITFLGMSLFFNRSLMRLGNLLVVAGVPVFVGPSRTSQFFFRLDPRRMRATACLGLGIFLTMVGWPVFGIILEAFGMLNLFGNMFPLVLVIAKGLPVIGPILKGMGNNSNNNGRNNNEQRDDRRADDYYYEDDDQRGNADDRYY